MTTDPVGTAASVFLFVLAAVVLLTILFYDRAKEWAANWSEVVRVFWRGFRKAWREHFQIVWWWRHWSLPRVSRWDDSSSMRHIYRWHFFIGPLEVRRWETEEQP